MERASSAEAKVRPKDGHGSPVFDYVFLKFISRQSSVQQNDIKHLTDIGHKTDLWRGDKDVPLQGAVKVGMSRGLTKHSHSAPSDNFIAISKRSGRDSLTIDCYLGFVYAFEVKLVGIIAPDSRCWRNDSILSSNEVGDIKSAANDDWVANVRLKDETRCDVYAHRGQISRWYDKVQSGHLRPGSTHNARLNDVGAG